MFDHMDGIMRALAKKKTQWKEDLYFTVRVARQMLSKHYAEVTALTSRHLISVHIIDSVWKLRSFMKWDKTIDMNPEDETSYTTQLPKALLQYVVNKYCAKHRQMSVINLDHIQHSNFIPSSKASGFGLSSFDPNDLSNDDDEYLTPKWVAEMTPRQSDRAAHFLTAARLQMNSLPESSKTRWQVNPNVNDYHCDPMEISSTFWLPHITYRWRQQQEMHSKYTDLTDVACNIFSIIPHAVGGEARFCLGREVIGGSQSKTSSQRLRDKFVVMQLA
jgi:hypothetical protein